MSFALRTLVALVASSLALVPHPADGPDVDVRIKITDERVRVVCAFNLAFVDAVTDVARAAPGAVEEDEREPLRAALFALLDAENSVAIDGVEVRPVVPAEGGFDVLAGAPEQAELYPRFGLRALTKVQLVLDYPAKSPPQSVAFRWGPFPPNAMLAPVSDGASGEADEPPPIEVRAQLTAEGVDSVLVFRADAPEQTWRATGVRPEDRFLAVPALGGEPPVRVPALSLGLGAAAALVLARALRRSASSGEGARRAAVIGAFVLLGGAAAARDVGVLELGGGVEPLERAAALAVFKTLHANIYRAFDYDDESAIYDALVHSVDGPLLDELFDQVYRSLINREADGARSSVRAVRLLEADVEPSDEAGGDAAFDVVARWQVDGAVLHWGHGHERTNEYRARYTVAPTPRGWRIAGSQVLEERRVDARPLEAGSEGR